MQVGRSMNIGVINTITEDRKSTRLNSSHLVISYAVLCLKKQTRPQGGLSSASYRHDIHPPSGQAAKFVAVMRVSVRGPLAV